jgi:hypothetical protein
LKNHCYRKCPATKAKFAAGGNEEWDSEKFQVNAPALDFLAALISTGGGHSGAAPAPVADAITPHTTIKGTNGPNATIRKGGREEISPPLVPKDRDQIREDVKVELPSRKRSLSPTVSSAPKRELQVEEGGLVSKLLSLPEGRGISNASSDDLSDGDEPIYLSRIAAVAKSQKTSSLFFSLPYDLGKLEASSPGGSLLPSISSSAVPVTAQRA